jgi:hypothetical protein
MYNLPFRLFKNQQLTGPDVRLMSGGYQILARSRLFDPFREPVMPNERGRTRIVKGIRRSMCTDR